MADDIAKSNFNDILSNLKRKFEITESKWADNKIYELKFRTQIPVEHEDYNKYCDHWVDEFSYVTDTVWVHKISNTGPKVKFRKQYQCWTYETKEVNKEILFDSRRCRATLDIKVLGDASGTKKINRFLRLGLNSLIKINFQHLRPVDTSRDYSFFVHWCKPLPEAPKPSVQSNERLSQLVAKVVENAPITSQKAAERAKEALKKQCTASPNLGQTVTQAVTDSQESKDDSCSRQLPIENETSEAIAQQALAQVIVHTSEGQTSDNVFYVHQVVFDSATQTLRDVIPTSANAIQTISDHHLIEVQMPAESSQLQPIINQVVNVQSNETQIMQHF